LDKPTVYQLLQQCIRAGLQSLGEREPDFDPDAVPFSVVPSTQPGHGDYSSNVAMLTGSALRKPDRRAVAEELAEDIRAVSSVYWAAFKDAAALGQAPRIEVAGPGFLNFFVDNQWYQRLVADIVAADEAYGRLTVGDGKRVNVEFVSANPTGPLTVGHGRNAVLGDVVARLYEWAGYDVTREYYFNNGGNQMRMLGESVRARYRQLTGLDWALPEGGYEGEYIGDIAQAVRVAHGDGMAEANESLFRSAAETAIFADIRGTLDRLGVRFDAFFNEKTLYDNGAIDEVIAGLRERSLAYDKDGAVWLRGEPLGLEKDPVLVKSSGEPTYRLPDMAYHRDKLRRGYDVIVDVFGADHIDTCQEVLAAVRALGDDTSRVKVVLYQFVTLTRGGELVKMSTRKANFETLDALLDEVGPDAVRYFFTMRSPHSHMEFDLDLARKQAADNPMYYVQYGHARICSIFARPEAEPLLAEPADDLSGLDHPAERALIAHLARLPDTLARALADHEPHRLTTYAAETATAFHAFYDRCPVLAAEPRSLARARLELCRAAHIVLRNVLIMLGVSAPERM
jgi:arginyl-tRNA synthetase